MPHPVREILVVHHSHTDWGYTNHPSVIGEVHAQFIDQAIDLCRGNADRPAELRYRWTCESAWVVHGYLRSRSPRRRKAFLDCVHRGEIEVAALPLHPTPLANGHTIRAALGLLEELRSEGVPIAHALGCDINGLSWPWVEALLGAGVDALGMAMNFVCGGGMPRWKAFYWKGADGGLLPCWQGTHYNQGAYWGLNHDAYPIEQVAPARVKELSLHPFEKALLQVTSIPPDNMGPHPGYLDGLMRYNQLAKENGWPQMRSAGLGEWFDFLLPRMDGAPVYEGDWSDWWAAGVGSTPRETAALLEAQRRAGLAVGNGSLETGKVYRKIFLAAEHTWGASTSVELPELTSSLAGLAAKQHLIYDAAYAANEALRGALPPGMCMHDPEMESFDPAWRNVAPQSGPEGALASGLHPFRKMGAAGEAPDWQKLLGDGFGEVIHEMPADRRRKSWFEVGRFNAPESHGCWPQKTDWVRRVLPDAQTQLRHEGAMLHVEVRLALEYTTEPRALYIQFPFRLAAPDIRVDVGGAWADPRQQVLPGACLNWWTVHHGVLLSSPEGAILWTPWDAPLTMFDAPCPNPPKPQVELNGPVATLVSWPLNTYWFTNFNALSGGGYRFRYRVRYWPHPVSPQEAEAFCLSDPLPQYPRVISVHGDGPENANGDVLPHS